MTPLQLIVETPRGGDAGHRFLTSSADIDERHIASIVSDASQRGVGANHISVSREIRQQLPNGTVRDGTERVVLAGVNVGELRASQVDEVKDELNQAFVLLDKLVETVSWQTSKRSTVIVRKELQDWLERASLSSLPREHLPKSSSRPTRPLRTSSGRWWAVVLIIAMAMLGGTILLWYQRDTGQDERTRSSNGLPPKGSRAFDSLARDWNCTEAELARSLIRAANWDRRREAIFMDEQAALGDGDALTMLNKVMKTNPPDQFFVCPIVQDGEELQRMAMAFGVQSASDSVRLRNWLYLAWQRYSDFRNSAHETRESLDGLGDADGFSRFIVAASGASGDVEMGDGFSEPTTPLFDRQDVMICDSLGECVRLFEATGFLQEICTDQGVSIPSDSSILLTRLRSIREHRSVALESIRSSRARLTDVVRLKHDGASADSVFNAYRQLESFLEHICTFPLD